MSAPVADSDEEAIQMLGEGLDPRPAAPTAEGRTLSVIFRLVDAERLRHFVEKAAKPLHGHAFGENWAGIGRMSGLDGEELRFTWNGGQTDLSAFDMGQMLAVGTELLVKFRLPLLQRGYCEAKVAVSFLEERSDDVKVGCDFGEIDERPGRRRAVRQGHGVPEEELRRARPAAEPPGAPARGPRSLLGGTPPGQNATKQRWMRCLRSFGPRSRVGGA